MFVCILLPSKVHPHSLFQTRLPTGPTRPWHTPLTYVDGLTAQLANPVPAGLCGTAPGRLPGNRSDRHVVRTPRSHLSLPRLRENKLLKSETPSFISTPVPPPSPNGRA